MTIMRRLLPSLALFLASCAGLGNDGRGYPSLARRPMANGATAIATPVPVPPSADDAAALSGKIAPLLAQADKGKTGFDAAYGKVENDVRTAQGAPVLTESWVAAHVSLSTLESARDDSVSALAGLDVLYAERLKAIAEGTTSGGADDIGRARDTVLAVVDNQNDRLDALKAMLKRP